MMCIGVQRYTFRARSPIVSNAKFQMFLPGDFVAGDDKPKVFAELASVIAIVATLEGGVISFLKASGVPNDLGALYGSAIKDLIWVVTCGAALIVAFVFLHYFETLGAGAEPAGSGVRERFDKERRRLADYLDADDSYAARLKTFLGWIDYFFDGNSQPTQRAYTLSEPAHAWSASAYDRCLLLALVYPILAIIFCWTVAGHVGPVESALGLRGDAAWEQRLIAFVSLLFLPITYWKFFRASGSYRVVWGIAFLVAFASAVAFAFAVTGAFAVIFASTGAFAFALAVTGAVAVTIAIAFAVTGAFAFAVAVAVSYLSSKARERGWQGVFLVIYTAIMFGLCFAAARSFSAPEKAIFIQWMVAKPLLLFLGLFTLVNAPFDWLSLGLTRLLLRYGIQKGGWWPYVLAVIDAVVASALITLLAVAMAWSNDLFNCLAEQGGGEEARVLPPAAFYLGMLEKDPWSPEFWWVYATLFSTMIPSVINLFIAGFSFLRTLPWSRNFVLANMREDETMPVVARLVSASILTAQVALAWPLAIAAQLFLTYVVLWQFMPNIGLGILHLTEKLSFA